MLMFNKHIPKLPIIVSVYQDINITFSPCTLNFALYYVVHLWIQKQLNRKWRLAIGGRDFDLSVVHTKIMGNKSVDWYQHVVWSKFKERGFSLSYNGILGG